MTAALPNRSFFNASWIPHSCTISGIGSGRNYGCDAESFIVSTGGVSS